MQFNQGRCPLVSVIIPTYNYGHFVGEAIQSAIDQTYSPLEIIVVDDGSSDHTCEIVKKFGNEVKYVYQTNRGLSAARNAGISCSNGEYIAILDADDVWLSNKIERQISKFQLSPGIGAVSCQFFEMDYEGGILRATSHCDYPNQEIFRKKLGVNNILSGGSSIVIKKECFDTVGNFDEELNSAEDWDMWLRISKRYEIRIVEEPLLKVRIGSYNMSSAGNALRMLNNEIAVINKHFVGNNLRGKSKAKGYRYFCAGWACYISGDISNATSLIWKSFCFYPVDFINRKQGFLMIKIFAKKILRTGIPVNKVTRPFFQLVYKNHVFLREILTFFRRFVYNEPLFRSQCKSIGHGLWMEELPYLSGKGSIHIGCNVRLSGRQIFTFLSNIGLEPELVIGDKTFIGHYVMLNIAKSVSFGQNCFIASRCQFFDNDGHPTDFSRRRRHESPSPSDVKEISVGNDVWIGTGATILKGVSIGDRSIVGVGAVVTKDVPADCIVAGNPARIVKSFGQS